jgi:hypothetical protein
VLRAVGQGDPAGQLVRRRRGRNRPTRAASCALLGHRRTLFRDPPDVSPGVLGAKALSESEVACEVGYLRLFRRKKIGPGLSLNASKSGLSLSFGPRGAKVTVGPRGVRRTVGVPGRGLYCTTTSSRRRKARATSDGAGLGYLVLLVIAIALIAAFWQYLVLIAVGGLGIGLIWWTRRRGPSAIPGTGDPQAMLTELGDLHAAGVLSDPEFQAKKAMILGSTQPDSSDLASPVSERLD